MKKSHFLLSLYLVLASMHNICRPVNVLAQTSQQQYLVNEVQDYYRGVYSLGYNNSRAWQIYQQLVAYSGMQYYIYYSQNFTWGSAHNGGIILVDYSILAKNDDVLAFVMAHEWGHQALGHAANIYNPHGGTWQTRRGGTSNEDAADDYAGRFLGTYGYDIDAIKRFLRAAPDGGLGDAHSTGSVRAETVADAYYTVRGGRSGDTWSGGSTACSHCDGEGEIIKSRTCYSCSGGGIMSCSACGGTGGVYSYGYNVYGRYGYWLYTCSSCSGGGRSTCQRCEGSGAQTTSRSCVYCDGTGRVSRD